MMLVKKLNKELVLNSIEKYPGLRFFEIKKQTGLVNGVLQHHLHRHEILKNIKIEYDHSTPRFYPIDLDAKTSILLKRLRQNTTSKIIKLLVKNECCTFGQMVKYIKKSPGTISIYKNKLLSDGIILGNTNECENCLESYNKIKYRLTNSEHTKLVINEYGKNSLRKSVDNLSDVFLALR
jgi:predicted transcriptional regulator